MILIKDLKLKYNSKQDIQFIRYPDITFMKGKINLLIGKNGSGKSTLGNYLFKINSVEKVNGDIFYNSKVINTSLVNLNFKYIPQERPVTYNNLTCNDIFKIFRSSQSENLNGSVFEKSLLKKSFSQLSTGEWKIFLIQNILALNKLNGIFLDELFAGLQINNKEYILDLLVEKTTNRELVTIVTHILLEDENNDYLVQNLNKIENYVNKIYLL